MTATRRLADAGVVITGASSGIGRATALEFARRGAAVVVAARRKDVLEKVVQACQRLGAHALAVPTAMTKDAEVEALAQCATKHFGRLDVWVNNAGVYVAGRLEDVTAEVFHRVIETNLLGYASGARSALRQFRRQKLGCWPMSARSEAGYQWPTLARTRPGNSACSVSR